MGMGEAKKRAFSGVISTPTVNCERRKIPPAAGMKLSASSPVRMSLSVDNLFVDAEGAWQAKYIPAFARRYPYVFSSSDQGKTLTLCIDEEYPGLNTDDEGERLFTDDGEQTEYLNSVLEFQKEFQAAFQRTQVFCKRLMDLELLEPMQAQMKFGSGEEKSIAGFQTVNRDKVKALDADTLAELVKVDELELIYLHLHSMQNITEVAGQVSAAAADEMASDTASTNKKKAASK